MVSIKGLLPSIHLNSHQVLDSFLRCEQNLLSHGVAQQHGGNHQSLHFEPQAGHCVVVWGRTSASHPGLVDILLVTSWETHWTLMVSVLDSGSRGPGSNTGLRVERSWFEHWTGSWVLIRDQAASVLCSWAKHFTHTVPLHIQEYKWVRDFNNMQGCNLRVDQRPVQGGVIILLFASCYGNLDKLRLDGLLGSSRRNGNRRGQLWVLFPLLTCYFSTGSTWSSWFPRSARKQRRGGMTMSLVHFQEFKQNEGRNNSQPITIKQTDFTLLQGVQLQWSLDSRNMFAFYLSTVTWIIGLLFALFGVSNTDY